MKSLTQNLAVLVTAGTLAFVPSAGNPGQNFDCKIYAKQIAKSVVDRHNAHVMRRHRSMYNDTVAKEISDGDFKCFIKELQEILTTEIFLVTYRDAGHSWAYTVTPR